MKKMVEIVIPELLEMRTAHIVSIGSESACGLNPDYEDGFVHLPLFSCTQAEIEFSLYIMVLYCVYLLT